MALVIPSYVPLNRLPAALGLQLSFAGVFFFIAGPVVGELLISSIQLNGFLGSNRYKLRTAYNHRTHSRSNELCRDIALFERDHIFRSCVLAA